MEIYLGDKSFDKFFFKKHALYKILNKVNGNWYVGSTISLANRLGTHRKYLRRNKHANSHLQNAYNKYGENNFVLF